MSEQAPLPTPSPDPSRPAPKKTVGRWRLRILRGLVLILIIAVAARVIVFFALRPTLRRVGQAYGVTITFDRQELTLAGGNVGLWGLKVFPKGGDHPLLACEYVNANVSPLELLRGNLRVLRAEADGVDVWVERKQDGQIPVLTTVLHALQTGSPPLPPPTSAPVVQRQLDFTSPLKIEAFRLNHVRTRVQDAYVTPARDTTLWMNVRVSDLGMPDRKTKFDLDLWADPGLDLVRISGEGASSGRNLDASASVLMRGLHPEAFACYLTPLGVQTSGSALDADLHATIKAQPADDPASHAVKAVLALDGIRLSSDQQSVATLKGVQVEAAEVDLTHATIPTIQVTGGRVAFALDLQGRTEIAGLLLTGSRTRRWSGVAPMLPYHLTVRDVLVRDVSVLMHDRRTDPACDLTFTLLELLTKGNSFASSDADPNSAVPVNASLTVPGVAQTIVVKGNLKPFALDKTMELAFSADKIRPDALRPYLTPLGVESLLNEGRLEGQFNAVLHPSGLMDARVRDVRFSDGQDLLVMDDINIRGVGADVKNKRVSAESIELTGPSIVATRDPQGRMVAMGMRWTPHNMESAPAARVRASSVVATTRPANTTSSLPRIQVNNFLWKGFKAKFRDEQIQPSSVMTIDDGGIEAHNVVVGLTGDDADKETGTFRAWLSSPALGKELAASGTLTFSANGFWSAEGTINGSGLHTAAFAPYLKPTGIEPTLRDGTVSAQAKLTVAQRDDAIVASLDVNAAQLREGDVELAAVDALNVSELSLRDDEVDVKSIRLVKPRLAISRDAEGGFAALGVRVVPSAASAPPATMPATLALPKIPIVASLHELRVDDAQIGWTDRAAATPVQTVAHATIQLDGLSVGKAGAPPATFKAALAADGILNESTATGSIETLPDSMALRADVDARGIRVGSLAAYVPPGIELSTTDGRLKLSIDAGVKNVAEGGIGGHVVVQNLDWRDGESPLASLSAMKLTAPRFDPGGNVIAIEEISLADLQTEAQILKDGSVRAFGLTIQTAPPRPPALPAQPGQPAQASAMLAAAVTGEQGDQTQSRQPQPQPQPEAQPENVATLVADARRPLPLITLEKLALGVRDVTLRTLNQPNASPVSLRNAQVINTERIEMGGKDPGSRPPVKLECKGELSPLASAFLIHTGATPLAPEPSLNLDVSASGIRGSAVTELFPELAPHIDGGGLTDGRFATKVEANFKFERRGPRDFDLSRGFVMDLAINGTEFRGGGDAGPVLASLESLRAEQVRVSPKNSTVFAKSMDLTNPAFDAFRDKDGLHLLGIVIILPEPTTTPPPPSTPPVAEQASARTSASLADAASPPPVSADSASVAPESGAAAAAAREIRIDRLTANGLNLRYQDRVVDPQMLVPLNNLDLEVRDLTTRALTEPRIIRFAALVNADKVPLPARKRPRNAEGNELAKEDRELFSQVTTVGRLALYPKPNGYVKTALNGVELAAFQGIAHQLGVTLQGGVLDGSIDARFNDVGDLDTKSKFVFTDLKLTEPPGGPISKVMGLPPGGLDAALRTLEDPDGSITVSVPVPVKNGEISGGAIQQAVLGALSTVMATAVASAPLKIAGGATDLVGLGGIMGGNKSKSGPQPLVIQFAPGSTVIEADAQQKLEQLLEKAKRDKNMQLTIRHDLGGGDVAIASERANPPAGDVAAMAQQLRQRKFELATQRAQLAGQARAQLASLPPQQSQVSLARLRAIDIESAEVERSLDQLYDLMRPGADRQATRRTRAAALQMGTERLDGVAAVLRPADLENAKDRVKTTGAQFNPADGETGGTIVITPIVKKR